MTQMVRFKGLSKTAARDAVATLIVDGKDTKYIAEEMGVGAADIDKMRDDPMVQAMCNRLIENRRASALGRVTGMFGDAIDTLGRLVRGDAGGDDDEIGPVPHKVRLEAARTILDLGGLSARKGGDARRGGDTNVQVIVGGQAMGVQGIHTEQAINDLIAKHSAEDLAKWAEGFGRARDVADNGGVIEGEP